MSSEERKMLLVGDNPFHRISHLSQERARSRGDLIMSPEYATNLVMISLQNGADGFMFSASETTLSILRLLCKKEIHRRLMLYAIVPYAFEYVRLATQIGTVGLAKKLAKDLTVSGNIRGIARGLKGIMRMDPDALLKAYLHYEISRIESAAGKKASLASILLHEILTDTALALDLDWLFKSYMKFMQGLGMKPGFNTSNFAYLVNKFRDWNLNLHDTVIAAPFNSVGFQMHSSRAECEKALASLPEPNVLAISVLAAGYLKPQEMIDYIINLPNIKGVVIGVSKEHHARDTFKLLKDVFVEGTRATRTQLGTP